MLNERNSLHRRLHQMPTIRVIESIKNRKTKLELLKPLTSVNKHRSLIKNGFSPNVNKDKLTNESSGTNNSSYVERSQFMTPSNLQMSPVQKLTLMNYKTLEELNKAFFTHKKHDNSEAVFKGRKHKSVVKPNNGVNKFADYALNTECKSFRDRKSFGEFYQ